ncbi:MAG: hypothetical protein LC637_10285 [Xanthomonadaceae bacterium]|nr:hypothetical protein [Xanthomonadaceae bacterium]
MTEENPGTSSGAEHSSAGNPVREMFILALFYLPLGFFLWFYLASVLMWFPSRLSDWVLTGFFPELFERVVQFGFQLEIQTRVQLSRQVEGQ